MTLTNLGRRNMVVGLFMRMLSFNFYHQLCTLGLFWANMRWQYYFFLMYLFFLFRLHICLIMEGLSSLQFSWQFGVSAFLLVEVIFFGEVFFFGLVFWFWGFFKFSWPFYKIT